MSLHKESQSWCYSTDKVFYYFFFCPLIRHVLLYASVQVHEVKQ